MKCKCRENSLWEANSKFTILASLKTLELPGFWTSSMAPTLLRLLRKQPNPMPGKQSEDNSLSLDGCERFTQDDKWLYFKEINGL